MIRTFAIVLAVVTSCACSESSPLAPGAQARGAAGPATLSGWVYQTLGTDELPLVRAVIEVTTAEGQRHSAVTDAEGFYLVAVKPGPLSITASKEGYEAKTWELRLSRDMVLNFGLAPM